MPITSTTYLQKSLDAQGNQISTYDHEVVNNNVQFNLKERNIYGSSRIGSKQDSLNVLTATIAQNYSQTLGNKYYEFSNHLGNVLTVFSDLKIPKDTDNNSIVDSYEIGMVSIADYSPFGVQLDGRTESGGGYRYGFNGMEKDDEFKGQGNSYTTEFRQYDARVGRWLSLDPLMNKYPYLTPFNFVGNSTNMYVDKKGDKIRPAGEDASKVIYPMIHNLHRIGLNFKENSDLNAYVELSDNQQPLSFSEFTQLYNKAAKKAKKDPYFKELDDRQLYEHYNLYLGISSDDYIEIQFTSYTTKENDNTLTQSNYGKEGSKLSSKKLNFEGVEAQKFFKELSSSKSILTKSLSDALYLGEPYKDMVFNPTKRLENAVYFESDVIFNGMNKSLIMIDITKMDKEKTIETLSNTLKEVLK
jgi:RHS repeat-associated protein